jgi:hypothetical protein
MDKHSVVGWCFWRELDQQLWVCRVNNLRAETQDFLWMDTEFDTFGNNISPYSSP